MASPLGKPAGSANFNRLAERKPDDYLALSQVFHQTYLVLEEQGTEAAAATALVPWSGGLPDKIKPLVFNGPGSGIQLRDGTLVFPAQFKDAAKQPHSCFIASTDGGNTWKISPAAIPGKPPTSEAQIVELSDGSLLLSMRNESRAGKRAWAKWTWKDSVMKGEWTPTGSMSPIPPSWPASSAIPPAHSSSPTPTIPRNASR